MRKPKITCFCYKKFFDIYVSNVSLSTDLLLSTAEAFLCQKTVVLAEAYENRIRALSSIGKSMGIAEAVSLFPVPRFSAVCSKAELHSLFCRAEANDFDGVFIAGINKSVTPNEFIAHTANAMEKDGISDVSISVNFPENQMVLSFLRKKYDVGSVKEKIRSMIEQTKLKHDSEPDILSQGVDQ